MASPVEICNLALDLIGQGTSINSMSEGTDRARKCTLHYFPAVREVLRAGKWKTARKTVALAQDSEAPAAKWAYRYALPADYVRLVTFNDTDVDDVVDLQFTIEGKYLHTEETTCTICYVADLTIAPNDINVSDPALTELFYLSLAIHLCWPFQQTTTLKQTLQQEYERKLARALSADAREAWDPMVNLRKDSDWLIARRFSTNA